MADTLLLCEGNTAEAGEYLLHSDESKAGASNSSHRGSTSGCESSDPCSSRSLSDSGSDPCSSRSLSGGAESGTCTELLQHHVAKVMNQSSSVNLPVCRDGLWRNALCFYKNCLHYFDRLHYELRIEFQDEEGIDAGALRCEFFESLMKEMNDRLFEGQATRRVPKRDSSLERNLELAGIMIGHSILQGGPAFPCLCPAVCSYLLYGDRDKALEEFPSVEDIPSNAATEGIVTLIKMHINCQRVVQIDMIAKYNG